MALLDRLMIVGYFAVLATVVVVTLRRRRIVSGEDLFLGGRSAWCWRHTPISQHGWVEFKGEKKVRL